MGELCEVSDLMIKDAMILLTNAPSIKQTIGLANFVIFNECESFA